MDAGAIPPLIAAMHSASAGVQLAAAAAVRVLLTTGEARATTTHMGFL